MGLGNEVVRGLSSPPPPSLLKLLSLVQLDPWLPNSRGRGGPSPQGSQHRILSSAWGALALAGRCLWEGLGVARGGLSSRPGPPPPAELSPFPRQAATPGRELAQLCAPCRRGVWCSNPLLRLAAAPQGLAPALGVPFLTPLLAASCRCSPLYSLPGSGHRGKVSRVHFH